jgi:hypothetical protein
MRGPEDAIDQFFVNCGARLFHREQVGLDGGQVLATLREEFQNQIVVQIDVHFRPSDTGDTDPLVNSHGAKQIQNVAGGVNYIEISARFADGIVGGDQQPYASRIHGLRLAQVDGQTYDSGSHHIAKPGPQRRQSRGDQIAFRIHHGA